MMSSAIQARIRGAAPEHNDSTECPFPGLMAFQSGTERDGESAFLPIDLRNYIELVDWTGRIARADKKGFIPKEIPSALSDLNLNRAQWCTLALEIQKESITMFNGLDKLAARERSRIKKAA